MKEQKKEPLNFGINYFGITYDTRLTHCSINGAQISFGSTSEYIYGYPKSKEISLWCFVGILDRETWYTGIYWKHTIIYAVYQ